MLIIQTRRRLKAMSSRSRRPPSSGKAARVRYDRLDRARYVSAHHWHECAMLRSPHARPERQAARYGRGPAATARSPHRMLLRSMVACTKTLERRRVRQHRALADAMPRHPTAGRVEVQVPMCNPREHAAFIRRFEPRGALAIARRTAESSTRRVFTTWSTSQLEPTTRAARAI